MARTLVAVLVPRLLLPMICVALALADGVVSSVEASPSGIPMLSLGGAGEVQLQASNASGGGAIVAGLVLVLLLPPTHPPIHPPANTSWNVRHSASPCS